MIALRAPRRESPRIVRTNGIVSVGAIEETDGSGHVDAERVRGVIVGARPRLFECFARNGVAVSVSVELRGEVYESRAQWRVSAPSAISLATSQCVHRVLSGLRFAGPSSGSVSVLGVIRWVAAPSARSR